MEGTPRFHALFKRRSATRLSSGWHRGLKPTATFMWSLRDPGAGERQVRVQDKGKVASHEVS